MNDRVVWRKWHTGTEHAHRFRTVWGLSAWAVCGQARSVHFTTDPTGENRCKRCERIVEKMEASDE